MNKHIAVLNVVGLSPSLIGECTPNIAAYAKAHSQKNMKGVFPAVTTTAQSAMVTGELASKHGIVGNGWYDYDLAEVMFWKQPNQLVQAEKIWETLKQEHPDFTCSKLFWWYNMYADVDASITPRPHYPADGRKIIDLYSTPEGLHQKTEEKLGKFPFFNFWGPKADIKASRWIADAAIMEFEYHKPNLQLVYLPHLDYCLQKFGPKHESIPEELRLIDAEIGKLLSFYEKNDVDVVLLSEYGIDSVDTPVHLNRVLRKEGYVAVRKSLTWELLDPGASDAFAVADHQIAHIYINDLSKKDEVKKLLQNVPGVEHVLDEVEKTEWGVDHERAGDLIVVAEKNAWFTYYYWLDDALAPDFAPTVDIHRKPGYDPAEMFVDEKIMFPTLRVIWRLIQKKLGFRIYMDVIPIHAEMVRGSHGRMPEDENLGPVLIGPKSFIGDDNSSVKMTDVYGMLKGYFLEN